MQKPPGLDPKAWFTSSATGYFLLKDRNGNIKEMGTARRTCIRKTELTGSCEQEFHFQYEPGTTRLDFEWQEQYENDSTSTLVLEGEGVQLKGGPRGPLLYFKGNRRIPHGEKKSASTEVHIHALPGEQKPVLEVTIFTYMGLKIGEMETFWLESGE